MTQLLTAALLAVALAVFVAGTFFGVWLADRDEADRFDRRIDVLRQLWETQK